MRPIKSKTIITSTITELAINREDVEKIGAVSDKVSPARGIGTITIRLNKATVEP